MSAKTCPYTSLPDRSFWKRVVAGVSPQDVDPVSPPPFRINVGDKVATAGSCFAQHIARYLGSAGVAPFVTEPAPIPLDSQTAAEFQYGTYSARYGNIYTARQLVQLFDRAFNTFSPIDDVWETEGRFYDPYRPSVQPHGFSSRRELELDRVQHLRLVRKMFEKLDVFVYTLGLTEAWINRKDGAVYPICPGCGWGTHDTIHHKFVNFGVDAVTADLTAFIERLNVVNPAARIILTVSPVPLVATAEDRHVLESTTLSKSVLRVSADVIQRKHANVAYFPSYEIITGAFSRGGYFDSDLRSVLPSGVDHVMRTFFSAYLPGIKSKGFSKRADPVKIDTAVPVRSESMPTQPVSIVERLVDLICEEDQLDPN